MKFSDVPKLPKASYSISVELDDIQANLERYERIAKLELNPDFQRGHVWTEEQQSKFIEWILRGGESGREIIFNCAGWQQDYRGPMYCVDGLQRLTAVLRFVKNEIKAFGHYRNEFEETYLDASLIFSIGKLETKKEVMEWYLNLNSGGTVHTTEELSRVQSLIEKEIK